MPLFGGMGPHLCNNMRPNLLRCNLTFSTLLTLVLIPVVYEIIDRKVYEGDRFPERSPGYISEDEAIQGAD